MTDEIARTVGKVKRCGKCRLEFPPTAFFKDSSKYDGLCAWCKECIARKKRIITPTRRASNLKRQRQYEKRYPERQAARKAVKRAVDSGVLKRQTCEVCGNPKTHGHHDDYSKPLEVRWLCQPHHVQAHIGRLPVEKFQ